MEVTVYPFRTLEEAIEWFGEGSGGAGLCERLWAENEEGSMMTPNWEGNVPLCIEENCPEYDGKRCKLMGFRPQRICEPAVKEHCRWATGADEATGPEAMLTVIDFHLRQVLAHYQGPSLGAATEVRELCQARLALVQSTR